MVTAAAAEVEEEGADEYGREMKKLLRNLQRMTDSRSSGGSRLVDRGRLVGQGDPTKSGSLRT